MRQHKFRPWDKKRKKWLGVNLHMAVADGTLWWQFGYGCEILSAEECKNIELAEYLNQKDINGVEICEDDILKDDYGRVLLVEWYKHGFVFKAITETNFFRAREISQWFEDGETPPEIIGNARENPELLKEAKPQK